MVSNNKSQNFILLLLVIFCLKIQAAEKKVYDFLLSLNVKDISIQFIPADSHRYKEVKRHGQKNIQYYRDKLVDGLKKKLNASEHIYLLVENKKYSQRFLRIFADVDFSIRLRQNNDLTLNCILTLSALYQDNRLASWEEEVWLLDEYSKNPMVEIERVIEKLFSKEFSLETLAQGLDKEAKYLRFIRIPTHGINREDKRVDTNTITAVISMLKGIQKDIVILKEAGRIYARTLKAFNLFNKGYRLVRSDCIVFQVKGVKKWPSSNMKANLKAGSFPPEEFTLTDRNQWNEADVVTEIVCGYKDGYLVITDPIYDMVISEIGLRKIRNLRKKIFVFNK